MDRDLYGSDHLRTAAILHALARLPALEHSGDLFAWAATNAFLALHRHHLDYPPKDAAALVHDTAQGRVGVAQIARRLRTWTT